MEQRPGPSHTQMDGAEADLVAAALDRFQVVRNRYLRWLIDYAPIVLGLWLLIDWVRWLDRSMIATDLFRVSTILTVAVELRNKAETLTPEQGKQRLEMLDFMQKVYEQSKTTPMWPFDTNSLWRFVAAQAVPLLGLISTTKPLIPVVQAALSALPK